MVLQKHNEAAQDREEDVGPRLFGKQRPLGKPRPRDLELTSGLMRYEKLFEDEEAPCLRLSSFRPESGGGLDPSRFQLELNSPTNIRLRGVSKVWPRESWTGRFYTSVFDENRKGRFSLPLTEPLANPEWHI